MLTSGSRILQGRSPREPMRPPICACVSAHVRLLCAASLLALKQRLEETLPKKGEAPSGARHEGGRNLTACFRMVSGP